MYDNADVGYVIGDVNATDRDAGQFGLIQYAIINDVLDFFYIDPTTVRHTIISTHIHGYLWRVSHNLKLV